MHRTFLKRFPLFIWLLFALSSVSSYGPDRRAEVISHLGSLVLCCCGEGGALHRRRCVWGALAVSWPGSQRLGALSTGAPRPLPPRPQCAPPVGSQGVFRQEPGQFAGWEGVASLGLSFPLSPPPTSYLQWGWAGSSLEFLSPFVFRTASSVFRPVNFSSLSHN